MGVLLSQPRAGQVGWGRVGRWSVRRRLGRQLRLRFDRGRRASHLVWWRGVGVGGEEAVGISPAVSGGGCLQPKQTGDKGDGVALEAAAARPSGGGWARGVRVGLASGGCQPPLLPFLGRPSWGVPALGAPWQTTRRLLRMACSMRSGPSRRTGRHAPPTTQTSTMRRIEVRFLGRGLVQRAMLWPCLGQRPGVRQGGWRIWVWGARAFSHVRAGVPCGRQDGPCAASGVGCGCGFRFLTYFFRRAVLRLAQLSHAAPSHYVLSCFLLCRRIHAVH